MVIFENTLIWNLRNKKNTWIVNRCLTKKKRIVNLPKSKISDVNLNWVTQHPSLVKTKSFGILTIENLIFLRFSYYISEQLWERSCWLVVEEENREKHFFSNNHHHPQIALFFFWVKFYLVVFLKAGQILQSWILTNPWIKSL